MQKIKIKVVKVLIFKFILFIKHQSPVGKQMKKDRSKKRKKNFQRYICF